MLSVVPSIFLLTNLYNSWFILMETFACGSMVYCTMYSHHIGVSYFQLRALSWIGSTNLQQIWIRWRYHVSKCSLDGLNSMIKFCVWYSSLYYMHFVFLCSVLFILRMIEKWKSHIQMQ